MVDVRGDVLRPPHGTTPAAVKANKIQKLSSFKSNEALHDSHLKSMFIFGKTFILTEMAGIKHRGSFIYFAPPPPHFVF